MYATRPPVKRIHVELCKLTYVWPRASVNGMEYVCEETRSSECRSEQGVMFSDLLQVLEKTGDEWEDAHWVKLKVLV